jgi:phenylalanyl-tRNA synthetase beta chain
MDISYRWLQRYVDVDLGPEALAERLTMAGLEVDDVASAGRPLDGVVVGEVKAVREHPDADRLVLCDVDLGDGEPVQIACGAPNVAAGQKAPVATVGTTLALPEDGADGPDARTEVTVEARTIRGEASHGMICAEDELGLSRDHSGIMVLDADAEVGRPFAEYLRERGIEPDDARLDVELTPNRPDAASHVGVARDVAALTDTPLELPPVSVPDEGGAAAERVDVELRDAEACPRYAAMVVRGVAVGPSPLWLRRRLTAIGVRPRNNIVDVTNFVLHECGQPLHAFDLDRLRGDRIVVRTAEDEETVTTLDDVERTVPAGTLLICDAERPVAVAGIMGGANTEVQAGTTDVLIESAYFDPSTIRRAAKALGMQTDSSYRFERGVDRDGQRWAAARAAALMAEVGGGTVVPGCVDAHPDPPAARTVALRPDRLREVTGTSIPAKEAARLLEAIGFDVARQASAAGNAGAPLGADPDALQCTVPTWRPDVTIEEDLIEEVMRLYGYDRIPEPDTIPIPSAPPTERPGETLRRQTRDLLRGRGYREVYTNSMLRRDRAERFNVSLDGTPAPPIVETKNPISQEMAALRPRLLPGALEVVRFNRNHGHRALRVFEFGRVFRQAAADEAPVVEGYHEHEALLVAVSGPHAPTGWDTDPRSVDIFDLKGLVETVLEDLRVPDVAMTPRDGVEAGSDGPAPIAQHPIDVTAGDVHLGTIARVHDETAAAFDLDEAPVYAAELNWDAVVERAAPEMGRSVEPVSRFPVVERDLAVLVGEDQPVGPMLDAIREAGRPLLRAADVFDVYAGEGVEDGRKSVAFTLRFGADRTLTDAEVDEQIDAVVDALDRRAGATLRQA